MTTKELREKDVPELTKLLAKTQEELRAIRFRVRTSEEKKVREVRRLRGAVARMLTLLNMKQRSLPKADAPKVKDVPKK